MSANAIMKELPLRWFTPPQWAQQALLDPLVLLNDHAHLEKKAAANALELLNRWPEPSPPENWVRVLTAVARDEVEHLAIVVRLLARRGGRLTRQHRNRYASELRGLVRVGTGPDELLDRLIVSSLIEARSCERFALLADGCEDEELAKLYGALYASEAGHYRVFLEMAHTLPARLRIEERWCAMLDAEAAIIQRQPAGSLMHSGVSVRES